MNRIIHIAAVFLAVCSTSAAFAQGGYTVSGTVMDRFGPVIGAAVIEQGTSNGTSTGMDGSYELTVSGPSAPVEISCIGYATQTFEAALVPDTVTLEEDNEYLDEAVVIGYGTVRKDDMTGSIAAIKADDLNRGAVTNTQDMLKGKVAGVLVTPGDGGPGSGSRIRIRGAASLNASNDPLIVIDGVPLANGAGGGMSNPLDLLNPNDIESFSVLKDASAAAIYGSRASNGVILITTKKGTGGKPQVTYNGSFSIMRNSGTVPVMSAAQLRDYYSAAYPAGTETGDRITALTGQEDTDWQSLIFRTAFATEHNLSVYGNVRSRMPYRASLGYLGQQGTLRDSYYDRLTGDFSLTPSFMDSHLVIDVNAKGVYSYSDYADSGAIGKAAFFNPTADPYWRNPDGTIDYTTTNGFWNYGNGRGDRFSPNILVGPSPLSMIYDSNSTAASYRFIGRAAVSYKIHGFEALKLNASSSIDITRTDSFNGVTPGSFQAWTDTDDLGTGKYSKGRNLSRSTLFETYADYSDTWGKHNLSLLAGYSWQNNFVGSRSVTYFNKTGEIKLSDGLTPEEMYPHWKSENFLVSFYGRINYSFDSRYVFTFSIRSDGSSRFAPDHRWGTFPSGAFAWNIAQEDFMKKVPAVSSMKLRLSVGVTGQQDGIGDYIHLARYVQTTDPTKTYGMGDKTWAYPLTPQAYDPAIRWETTVTYNAGLDFGFFNERLTGSIDAYVRNTRDLLNSVQIPMGSNFGNRLMTNIGSIRNKGIEFSLSGIPVKRGDWSVQAGFNGTFQNTVFTKLNTTEDRNYYIETGNISKGTGGYLCRQMVGYAPYTYYVYKQKYDSDGKPLQNQFVDLDGDGFITGNDRYMTGKSASPKFFYGLNVKISWRNWDLGLNGHGAAGTWVFNDFASAYSTSSPDLNSGSLPNQATVVLKTGFKAPNSGEQWYSDYFIENASFFRLDDINAGYTFRRIGRWETDIRLGIGMQNVFILTGYSGMDPEVISETGIDNAIWPRSRTWSIRLNASF